MDSEAVSDATSTSHHGDLICQKDSTSETEDKLLGPGDHGLLQAIKSECDETVLEVLSAPGNRFSPKTLDDALFEMCKTKSREGYAYKNLVEILLDLGANFESVSEDGWKPVLVAANTGNAKVLKSLLKRGANVNAFNTEGNSALILSIRPDRSLDVIKLLIRQRRINTHHINHQGYTALMKAVEAKDIEAMQILLDNYEGRYCKALTDNFDSDETLINYFGQAFFDVASKAGMLKMIKLLLHLAYGDSPLMEAALKADEVLVEFVVNSRFYKISELGYGYDGFLQTFFEKKKHRNIAIGDSDIPVVKMLLESGISVNRPEDGYRYGLLEPPIVTAVTAGSYGLVQLMCKYGAMLEVTARYTGKTPVYLAAESGRADILQLLIDNNASDRSSEYKDSPLHFCLRNGHTKCAEILLTPGIEIDFQSAVECAIQSNKKESIEFLLKRSVSSVRNVFQVNINQMLTRLAIAVNNDHIDVINSLLEAKIILPIFLLSDSSSVAMVKLLVSHGASVNQKSDSGDPVLHLILSQSFYKSSKEIVEILLQYGANVNDTDSEGLTPLMVAAQWCHNKDVLNILLLHGADINMKDNIGTTALMHALNYHNREITKCLVEYEGKHTIEEDDCGDTALTTAARKGDTYTLMKLIEKGADINHQNKYGRSALMFAAAVFDKDSIEVLLDAGADVNLVSHGQQKMTAISLWLKKATLFHRRRLSLMPDLYSPMDSLLKKGATSSYLQPSDFFYLMEIEEYIFIPRLVCSGFGPPDFCLSKGDEPPQFSPFFWALVKGKPSLARYFQNIWFLTKFDIYLQTMHHLVAELVAKVETSERKCLDILNEFCSQPMSLLKLSFVTVSSAIGCVPGREEKIKQLPLPEVMKDKLLFKRQDEEERELAEEMNFLHI